MKGEQAKQILPLIGGTVCIDGVVLSGDEAIKFLTEMSDQDAKSLLEDLRILETQHEKNL